MDKRRFTALLCGVVAAAALALVPVSAGAQAPTQSTVKKKQQPTQVASASRPPTRVVVRRRSFLDPGTETKGHEEPFLNYAFPPTDQYFGSDRNDFRLNWNRMPFPSCLDLYGFCR